ncbi:ras-related protein ced-10-like [Neocloeon triangulifer]|uniref:ras-related protein ced-10-like n=1 Tax=Neocloeon triangulifer TaxID=2078957 RepID=UPI00286F5183|nr:ras-related protein ced-10-like [Neocloeon triangulifer]
MSSKVSRVESTASAANSTSSKIAIEDERSIKCVVVGDGTVGKTSLLISYTSNRFPTEYVPTIFDNYTADVVIDGENHKIGLFDTAGEEDYDKLRPLSYPRTDVFIVCFAVDSPDSFVNMKLKWIPELRHYCPRTPILLVGTKADLRNDIETIARLRESNMEVVSNAEAQEAQKKMQLYHYSDCSALTRVGVKHVFDQAIKAALKYRKQRTKRQCHIL